MRSSARTARSSTTDPSSPSAVRSGRRESPVAPVPKRILLVSHNHRLSNALSRRLGTLGHRVWRVSAAEDGPLTWSPRLYDIVVFSADEVSPKLSSLCETAKKTDGKLLLVMLAGQPFGSASGIPDVVISENEERAIAEKLLALANGGVLYPA